MLGGEYMAEISITNLIIEQFKDLKRDVNKRLDKIESKIDNLVTTDDCKNNQNNCQQIKYQELEAKKNEWSYRKITAIIGISSGCFGVVLFVIKSFFPQMGV
jgi:hypothetical protein